MGNCLCIPKKHRRSGSGPEKEKNTGSSEEQPPNNGVLCDENSETFVSQAELPCEGPIIPEDNRSKCTIMYVCPIVSSSILLRYDDEDEQITTELAGGPNKCETAEQKFESNDATTEPTCSDDQVLKADQTTCTAVHVDSARGAITTEVDKHDAAEEKAESSYVTHEPTVTNELKPKSGQMSRVDGNKSEGVPQLAGSEIADQNDEPKSTEEPIGSKDLTSKVESEAITKEFPHQPESETSTQRAEKSGVIVTTSSKDNKLSSAGSKPFVQKSLGREKGNEATKGQRTVKNETPNTATRLIEVREFKENTGDEPTSMPTEKEYTPEVVKNSESIAYKFEQFETPPGPTKEVFQAKECKENCNAVLENKRNSKERGIGACLQLPNKHMEEVIEKASSENSTIKRREIQVQESNDSARDGSSCIATKGVPSKKATDKSVPGNLSQGEFEEYNKGLASATSVKVIKVEEVNSNSASGETITAMGQLSTDIDTEQTKHRKVKHSDVVMNGIPNTKSTVSQQIGRFVVEPVSAQSVQGNVTERKTITGVADVETPVTKLSIKGAMSSPAVPIKQHVSSHIKEFGALLNVLSALKIPQQKVTPDSNIVVPSNNKATSDDPITASTSKAHVFGPQSDSYDKFGVYKSKQGIENWLQQSNSGTSSQRVGESNTSVASTTKKVSDFDIPKKARKPPPAPLVLKKPSPHLYCTPAIAKSDTDNKVNWTQLEAKGPQTEVLWTTKPSAFNVKLPPLPKRLLERKGSVEKLQESWVLPQVKQIETLKRECGRFPGLVVPTPLRHKYSVAINNIDELSQENDDDTVDTIDKAKKEGAD